MAEGSAERVLLRDQGRVGRKMARFAEARGWVVVKGDQIKRGAVDPRPPVPPPRSARELRSAWGPDWIG
jgi:hypothetical protein